MYEKIKQIVKKYVVVIVLALVLIGTVLSYIQKYLENKRLHEDLIGKKQEFERISEHAANLEREYVTQKELLEEVEKQWKSEKGYLEGRIKLLSNATFLIREKARETNASDLEYKGDRVKYVVNEIRFEDGPPVGYVLIFDDGRVTSKIYNHIIDVKSAVSRDEDKGTYSVLSKADYVLKSPSLSKTGEWTNKPYPLNISGGKALIDPTEPNKQSKRFQVWAPSIGANINASSSGIAPGVGFSALGYGYSKRDLDWKFLQVGTQYSEKRKAGLTATPVLYRPLPNILTNTYVGPGVSVDKDGTNYFLGLSIGL